MTESPTTAHALQTPSTPHQPLQHGRCPNPGHHATARSSQASASSASARSGPLRRGPPASRASLRVKPTPTDCGMSLAMSASLLYLGSWAMAAMMLRPASAWSCSVFQLKSNNPAPRRLLVLPRRTEIASTRQLDSSARTLSLARWSSDVITQTEAMASTLQRVLTW